MLFARSVHDGHPTTGLIYATLRDGTAFYAVCYYVVAAAAGPQSVLRLTNFKFLLSLCICVLDLSAGMVRGHEMCYCSEYPQGHVIAKSNKVTHRQELEKVCILL
jgi:hypothetical protein